MQWTRVLTAASTVAALLQTAPALACPSCPTSRLVSATVCGAGMWHNLAVTAAPFAAFAALAIGLHRIGRPRKGRGRRPQDED
jgi:hypothetical protein